MPLYKGMAVCVKCLHKMLNYRVNYANIEYVFSLCWRPTCNGYFEIIPNIPSELTKAISQDPRVIFDLLKQKILKPIL